MDDIYLYKEKTCVILDIFNHYFRECGTEILHGLDYHGTKL